MALTGTLSSTNITESIINPSFSGLASSISDFSLSSTNFVIATGNLASTIYITSLGDTLYENTESITVGISSLSSATTSSVQSVGFSLTDNETTPSVT